MQRTASAGKRLRSRDAATLSIEVDLGRCYQLRLFERLRAAAPPADMAPALPTSDQTYQVLLRSCAALTRYAILVAAHRLSERGVPSEILREELPVAELEKPEPWMKEVASTDLRGLFLHAQAAIRFLTCSPSVIPAKIPDELDAAGLLRRRDGKPWLVRYGREATRPYGPDGLNAMVESNQVSVSLSA